MNVLGVIGIFMIGAAAGSIFSYAQHRHLLSHHQRQIEELSAGSIRRITATMRKSKVPGLADQFSRGASGA